MNEKKRVDPRSEPPSKPGVTPPTPRVTLPSASGEHPAVLDYEKQKQAAGELGTSLKEKSELKKLLSYMAEHADKTVLVVDDNPEVLRALSMTLEAEDYVVHVAQDGLEGLNELDRMPRPDVILLDMAMPRYDGWSLLAFKKQTPHLADIPVIIISSREWPDLGAMQDEEWAFVKEPFTNLDILLDTVKKKVEKSRAKRRLP